MGASRHIQMSAFFLLLRLCWAYEKQLEQDPRPVYAEKQVHFTKNFPPVMKKIYRSSESLPCFKDIDVIRDASFPINMVVSVDNFGAVGDGITDDTKAFKDAWNGACSKVFPIFLVPRGKIYLVKPIKFSGPCRSPLTVQISGTIIAPKDPNTWTESQSSYWLLFSGVNNLVVGGGGVINGRGEEWWAQSCKINKTNPCKPAPTAVIFESINNLWVKNIVVQNSPKFHLTIHNCVRVEANFLEVLAPEHSPNTDGIHISASKYVIVRNAMIGTGDDCISIVSESFDILIQSVTCGPGHGISIGSLGKGNSEARVSAVTVDGAFIHDTTNGLRIKTWQGGSGYAQGIKYQNVYMQNVSNPIIINQYYCDSLEPCPNQTSAVRISEVGYFNIIGTSATEEAIRFACSSSVPCENVVLENVYLTLNSGDAATSICENVTGFNLGIVTPSVCFQELYQEKNRRNSQHRIKK